MEIVRLKETDSTNSEIRRRLPGLGDSSVVFAEAQSLGRGQGDHTWFSTPGENLTFSIYFEHQGKLPVDHLKILMDSISQGVCDYLSSYGVEAVIKFPNDILVGGRKICGILIENFLDGKTVRGSIVGVGFDLNEHKWPDDIQPAVSLMELTGRRYDVYEELEKLVKSIVNKVKQI